MHLCISSLHTLKSFDTSVIHVSSKHHLSQSLPSLLGARSETSGEATVRSNLVGNAGSRPISEAKQPWACPVLGWGTTGEAHVLYSFSKNSLSARSLRSARAGRRAAPGDLAKMRASPRPGGGAVAPPAAEVAPRPRPTSCLSVSVSVGWQWSALVLWVQFPHSLKCRIRI